MNALHFHDVYSNTHIANAKAQAVIRRLGIEVQVFNMPTKALNVTHERAQYAHSPPQ
jgi:hypothetical protein